MRTTAFYLYCCSYLLEDFQPTLCSLFFQYYFVNSSPAFKSLFMNPIIPTIPTIPIIPIIPTIPIIPIILPRSKFSNTLKGGRLSLSSNSCIPKRDYYATQAIPKHITPNKLHPRLNPTVLFHHNLDNISLLILEIPLSQLPQTKKIQLAPYYEALHNYLCRNLHRLQCRLRVQSSQTRPFRSNILYKNSMRIDNKFLLQKYITETLKQSQFIFVKKSNDTICTKSFKIIFFTVLLLIDNIVLQNCLSSQIQKQIPFSKSEIKKL